MTTAVADHIRAGTSVTTVQGALAQLEDELAALERRGLDISKWIEKGQQTRSRLDSLSDVSRTAAARLDGADLATQREVLDLLAVRVQVTEDRPAIRLVITGTVASLDAPAQADTTAGKRIKRWLNRRSCPAAHQG
ncbi:MAG: hypothetical protein ABSA93_06630 [Streptosporangiaceae bacterium]|jgi:hypothetical protein